MYRVAEEVQCNGDLIVVLVPFECGIVEIHHQDEQRYHPGGQAVQSIFHSI